MQGFALRMFVVLMIISVVAVTGCGWWKSSVTSAPTPVVAPDLQPTADELAKQATALRTKLDAAKSNLAASAKTLEELAAKNKVDVTAQRKAVDAALAQCATNSAAVADLQTKLDALSAESASAKKYETVLQISGMVFCLILMAAVMFAPLPALIQGIKWYLFAGLTGALVIGVIATILQRFAKGIIIGSIVAVVLGAVGLIAWIILSGKYKSWLQKVGIAVAASPAAVSIATATQASGTPGLGAVLDEVGAKVTLPPTTT
jgi:hypothetical protein